MTKGEERCTECGYPRADCEAANREQKKCCPDCSHPASQLRDVGASLEAARGYVMTDAEREAQRQSWSRGQSTHGPRQAVATQDRVVEVELTEQQIREQMTALCERAGMSVEDALDHLDHGELRGTIFESELHMLRFLLGEEAQP